MPRVQAPLRLQRRVSEEPPHPHPRRPARFELPVQRPAAVLAEYPSRYERCPAACGARRNASRPLDLPRVGAPPPTGHDPAFKWRLHLLNRRLETRCTKSEAQLYNGRGCPSAQALHGNGRRLVPISRRPSYPAALLTSRVVGKRNVLRHRRSRSPDMYRSPASVLTEVHRAGIPLPSVPGL